MLSCRADEFRAAVHPDLDQRPIHLDGAAGIHLTPLTSTAIRGYLLAGAGSDGPTRWAQALTALADPTSSVAQALTTPLTAFLASSVYNPRPWESSLGLPDPTDLCALPTAAAVEQHLLAGFIPAAYRPHPGQSTRWTIEQATRYLTFLGHHLEHRLHTTSLAWWEIPRATPSTYRILTAGLTGGLAIGLASAWGRLGLARPWLAARRQQPLHLIAFLEDAQARGVLRQAGAGWEFRHANLQRHLAGSP